jgi:hypothetical protein
VELGPWVDAFIDRGDSRGIPEFLARCLEERVAVGLAAVQRLFRDMHGGWQRGEQISVFCHASEEKFYWCPLLSTSPFPTNLARISSVKTIP